MDASQALRWTLIVVAVTPNLTGSHCVGSRVLAWVLDQTAAKMILTWIIAVMAATSVFSWVLPPVVFGRLFIFVLGVASCQHVLGGC